MSAIQLLRKLELEDSEFVSGRVKLFVAAGAVLVLFALPLFMSEYNTFILSWMLVFGIVALAYNLLLGYAGMISFGHAMFFGGGAYTVAVLSRHGNVESLLVLILATLVVSLALSWIMGFLTIRHLDIYFALLTLAVAMVLYALVVNNYTYLGGTDGLGLDRPTFLGVVFDNMTLMEFIATFYYWVVLLIFIVTVFMLWLLAKSPMGLTLKTIRDNQGRSGSIGIHVRRYKMYAMLISGTLTGLAGGLFAILQQHVTPELIFWTMSGDILFLTVLGGPSTFLGPVIGAGAYVFLRQYAVAFYGDYWRFVMGFVILVVVLTVRDRGVWGALKDWTTYIAQRFNK